MSRLADEGASVKSIDPRLRRCFALHRHAHLLEFFPEYDYRRCRFPERLAFSRSDNLVGDQQQAFNVWWAIECTQETHPGSIGLELGAASFRTPWCLATDRYMGVHPDYGTPCLPMMELQAEDADSGMFEPDSFSLVLANHLVEHLSEGCPGGVGGTLRGWIDILMPGGILAMVLPDNAYVPVLQIDPTHTRAWTAGEFREQIVVPLLDVADLVEFDTLNNGFSFQAVLRKKNQ